MANIEPNKLFSFKELIPEFDEITGFLDQSRDERQRVYRASRADPDTAKEHFNLIANKETGETFGDLFSRKQHEFATSGVTGGPKFKGILTDDQIRLSLNSAQQELTKNYGKGIRARLNAILSGRNYGGYGAGPGTPQVFDIAENTDIKFQGRGQGMQNHPEGGKRMVLRPTIGDDDFLEWSHRVDKEYLDWSNKSPNAPFRARGAKGLLTKLEPLITSSEVLTNRITPDFIRTLAKTGAEINGISFYDPATGMAKTQPFYPGVTSDLVQVIDNGTGDFTIWPDKLGFNTQGVPAQHGNAFSSNTINLAGVDPIEAAKIYSGQKLGQWEFEKTNMHKTVDEMIAQYRANPTSGTPLDQPLRGGVGHWGGWLTSPLSDYRAAALPEFTRAMKTGELIQESPAIFDAGQPNVFGATVAGRPDYLGPNYFNRNELLWNYVVNSSKGGSYRLDTQPAIWETYLGSDAQRYPSSYVKIGSYAKPFVTDVIDTLSEGIVDNKQKLDTSGNYVSRRLDSGENKQLLDDVTRIAKSNPLLDDFNHQILQPGVRQNPRNFSEQISGGDFTYTHPGNPYSWDSTYQSQPHFGLQLHTGIASNERMNPGISQSYSWLLDSQEEVFQSALGNESAAWIKGPNNQLQITPWAPDSQPQDVRGMIYKNRAYSRYLPDSNWSTLLASGHPSYNVFQGLDESASFRDWTTIGQLADSTTQGITIAPPSGDGGRHSPLAFKWSQGFKLEDYPTRAFLPLDPNNPKAGWREAFSNFEKFGLGELSGEAKSWNDLEPYVIEHLRRIPNFALGAYVSTRPEVNSDSLDRLKRFFKYNTQLSDREAFDYASRGIGDFEKRFGLDTHFSPIAQETKIRGVSKYKHQSVVADFAQNKDATIAWLLDKKILPNTLAALDNLQNLSINTHELGDIVTYDQLNGFIQSIRYNEKDGFFTPFLPHATDSEVSKILQDITTSINVYDREASSTPKAELTARYLPTAELRSSDPLAASLHTGDELGHAQISSISAQSPKAAILASKGLLEGSEFFNAEQKKFFQAIINNGSRPDGAYGKRGQMRPGFIKLDMLKPITNSFINVAQGVMPSQETIRLGQYLSDAKNAEKFTQNMVNFSQNYRQLTPATKEAVDALMMAKLGQKFASFVTKAGVAMAVVAAPFDAKNRQDIKMARWEKDIEKNGTGMGEGEIMALAALNGVISGLENIPNFLTFGEYDAAMGYRETGLFSGMQKGMENLSAKAKDVRKSPYARPGFKTVNNAGTRFEENTEPEPNLLLQDLTK
jgi:hypothetical protein